MTQSKRFVACPTCKNLVEFSPTNPYRPFCSKRCEMIDLGAWANEDYTIPAATKDDDLPDELTQ